MKYSNNVYIGALQALAALRSTATGKEKATIDFIAEAIAEKGDRDRGNRPEPTDALTLDELRKMDGEPVWIKSLTGESGRWGLVSPFRQATTGKLYVYTYDTRHGEQRYSDQEYGMVWIAYRRKLEEEHHNGE